MAKKRKQTYSNYTSFKLHGKFSTQTVLVSSGIAFISGFVGGMYLKPYLVGVIIAYAGNGY